MMYLQDVIRKEILTTNSDPFPNYSRYLMMKNNADLWPTNKMSCVRIGEHVTFDVIFVSVKA